MTDTTKIKRKAYLGKWGCSYFGIPKLSNYCERLGTRGHSGVGEEEAAFKNITIIRGENHMRSWGRYVGEGFK